MEIYIIKCSKDPRVYLGYSANVEERYRDFSSKLNRGKHPCVALQEAWDKHGSSSFSLQVLKSCAAESVKREVTRLKTSYALFNSSGSSDPDEQVCLFRVRCSTDPRSYIGVSKDPFKLWLSYQVKLVNGNHPCLDLQEAWTAYGPSVFTLEEANRGTRKEITALKDDLLYSEPSFNPPKDTKTIFHVVCKPTGMTLVSASVDYITLWKTYRAKLQAGTHFSPILQNLWNVHGESNFEVVVFEEVPISSANEAISKHKAELKHLCINP